MRSPGTSKEQSPLQQGLISWLYGNCRKLPLRVVLVVPFVIEVIIAVGLTGYFSYRNGQQAVNKLATQLMQQESDRISRQLNDYLTVSPQFSQTTANLAEMGMLNFSDLRSTGQYFLKQRQLFPEISYIGFGNPKGDVVGTYLLNHQPVIELLQVFGKRGASVYTVDRAGEPAQLIQKETGYPLANLAWFTHAVRAGNPTWDEIYYQPNSKALAISFNSPVYNSDHRLLGVLSIHNDLVQISHFLNQLELSQIGTVFIVDRSGLLVTNSGDQPSYKLRKGRAYRLKASDSRDAQIAEIASQLNQQFGSVQTIREKQQLSFFVQGESHFVQVTPFKNRSGLDWLIVTAMPESGFMAETNHNNQNTILLCIGALLGAIALGWFTAQWIARPILRLSRASRALTLGEWDYPVEENSRISELEVLAHSFNQMTEQLQQSFDQVKTALEESEEKFTKVFRTSPDAVNIVTVPEARYLDVNEGFLESTGYSREEVIGRTAFELKLIANMEQVQHFQYLLDTNQEIRNVEFDFCTKSGQIRTALLSSEVIELEGQQCILSVSRDISDRKQLEIALQRSEAKLKDVLNSATIGICSFRLYTDDSLQYEYFSAGYTLIYGYTAEEMMANTKLWHSRVHPEDLKKVILPAYKKLLKHHSISTEYRFFHKDGTLRWISDYLTARWDEVVDCLVITTAAVDRTARRQAEEALHQAYQDLELRNQELASVNQELQTTEAALRYREEQLRQVTDALPVYISYLNTQQRYEFVNQLYEARFGWSREEFYGKHIREVLGDENYQKIQQLLEQALAGHLTAYTIEQSDQQGITRYLDVTLIPDFDHSSRVRGCYSLIIDSTARKQAEEALRQSEATKNQILRAIPDLIIWMTGDGICLDVINGSGLDSAIPKAEAIGKNLYDLLPPDVAQQRRDAIQQAIETGEVQVYEHQLTIQAEICYEEVRVVVVGTDRVLVMIRDITDRKKAEVTLRQNMTNRKQTEQALDRAERERVASSVMPRSRQTLFQSELSVHPITTTVDYTRQPNRRVIGLAPGQPKFRVLVVDDVPANRLFLVDLLSRIGFEVQEAANGEVALDCWECDPPDLIWMDMQLSGMDGHELVQWIRAEEALNGLRPQSHPTAIIAISAQDLEGDRQQALASGCDDFVSKPCSESIVFEKLSQFLGVEYLYEDGR